jgi:diguanylate cyclase (GGDEF)-like protein
MTAMSLSIGYPERPTESRLTSPSRLAALEATGLLDGRANDVLDRITRLATRVLGVPVSLASLVSDLAQHFPGLTGLEGWAGAARSTPLSHSYCQYVVRHGAPFIVEDAAQHALVRDNGARVDLGVTAYAGVPLRTVTGEILGAFCAISTAPRRWSTGDIETLGELASIAMAEIELRLTARELRASNERLLEQRRRDPLTGLCNREGFLEASQDRLADARRARTPCVLGVFEIDDFRLVNSAHGYVAGDAVLLEVSTMLSATFRDDDLVARTGSDEFTVLVSHATTADVPFIAARLEAALDVHNASPSREHRLSLSSGYAAWNPAVPVSITTLLQRADADLHAQRSAARNADGARVA